MKKTIERASLTNTIPRLKGYYEVSWLESFNILFIPIFLDKSKKFKHYQDAKSKYDMLKQKKGVEHEAAYI